MIGQNIATDESVETRTPFSSPYTSDLHHNLKQRSTVKLLLFKIVSIELDAHE
ncbi:hypothetical protein HanXRQr2_Chr14g0642181 [Helianthus annuus]|uniref:Uncharacterized protein n=1 Tax=Helianthus annuus TaxID=4232 RepID=A0A9K3E8J5_HELAN|nr:hypothetical protein HanXRQr2_Chr14g0642181 [Helianthus annuus]KAJ0840218.1 hypothetical protein HanPSC8_Chr14g0616031 [Helianthus annuus]